MSAVVFALLFLVFQIVSGDHGHVHETVLDNHVYDNPSKSGLPAEEISRFGNTLGFTLTPRGEGPLYTTLLQV
jgi:hypothetical protein